MARCNHLHANFNYQSTFRSVLVRHRIYINAVIDLKLISLRSCSKAKLPHIAVSRYNRESIKSIRCLTLAHKLQACYQTICWERSMMSRSDHTDWHSGLNIQSELVHPLGFNNYFTRNTYLQHCSQGWWVRGKFILILP